MTSRPVNPKVPTRDEDTALADERAALSNDVRNGRCSFVELTKGCCATQLIDVLNRASNALRHQSPAPQGDAIKAREPLMTHCRCGHSKANHQCGIEMVPCGYSYRDDDACIINCQCETYRLGFTLDQPGYKAQGGESL